MKKHAICWLAVALALSLAIPAWAGDGDGDEKNERSRAFVMSNAEPGSVFFSSDGPFELRTFLGRGFLGVSLTDLTPELRAHFAESEDAGVMVSRVVDGSPAATAGLQVGDVITAVDGELVKRSWELTQQVRQHEPEEQVSLEIFRDGRRQLIEVTLAERDRAMVDLGKHLSWRREGEDGPWMIGFDGDALENLPDGLMDRARLEKLRGTLEKIDWKTVAAEARDSGPRNEELQLRLKKLEERLEKLSAELTRLHEDQ